MHVHVDTSFKNFELYNLIYTVRCAPLNFVHEIDIINFKKKKKRLSFLTHEMEIICFSFIVNHLFWILTA